MPDNVVVDAGGMLTCCGTLDGTFPFDGPEMLALDWASLTVARFLSLRHEGRSEEMQVEIGVALHVVHEWFPVRGIVADTIERAGVGAVDTLDSWSAVILAESLDLPLLTASDEVTSDRVEIHRPW